jgi:hypothetical protein
MDTEAIISTLDELARSVATIANNAALARLKADLASYFREVPAGVKLNWCDGVLTKLAGETATYKGTSTGPFGVTITLTATTDLAIWRKVPAIEASWQTNYPGAFAGENILALIDKLKTLIGDGTCVEVPPVPPVIPPVVLPPPSSGKIKWLTTKAEALAQAKARNLRIFLLAGKLSCSVTEGMKNLACELQPTAAYPDNPPIKALIESHFIPWWADINGKGHIEYEEYAPYGSFDMPLMCIIDANGAIVPKTDSDGVVRKYIVGNTKYQKLYDWLQKYT